MYRTAVRADIAERTRVTPVGDQHDRPTATSSLDRVKVNRTFNKHKYQIARGVIKCRRARSRGAEASPDMDVIGDIVLATAERNIATSAATARNAAIAIWVLCLFSVTSRRNGARGVPRRPVIAATGTEVRAIHILRPGDIRRLNLGDRSLIS